MVRGFSSPPPPHLLPPSRACHVINTAAFIGFDSIPQQSNVAKQSASIIVGSRQQVTMPPRVDVTTDPTPDSSLPLPLPPPSNPIN